MTALEDAVSALHARVDAWARAVETVGLGDDPDLDDPRLEAAEEEFEHAVASFQRAALLVLGDDLDEEDEDEDLEVEELALHLLVGLPVDAPEPAQSASAIVHAAGERLSASLTTAGYQVPAWQFGCPTELLLDEEEDELDEL